MNFNSVDTIHEMFQRQVELVPNNIAIRMGKGEMTYSALNSKANQIAITLRKIGIKKSEYIGIYMDKGMHAIVTMLAVLKAGGAFVVLDHRWSRERLSEVISISQINVICTQKCQVELVESNEFTQNGIHTVIIVDGTEEIRNINVICENDFMNNPNENLNIEIDSSDVAHLYFTSGTSGKSKGIYSPHKVIVHLANSLIQEFKFGKNSRFSQLSTLSFDSSLRDIFIPLFSGGVVDIPTTETFTDMSKLVEWIDSEGIEVIQCVPSIFNRIVNELSKMGSIPEFNSLKWIFQAGELLNVKCIMKWNQLYGERVELVNLYGTTETMVKSFYIINCKQLPFLTTVPIGRPIPNTELIILNKKGICKIGEKGTLYVRTPYLAYGYLENEELTNKKFIQSPFHNDYEDVFYDTGDLAKYLPDRNVVVLGRNDFQMKIQGVRVEIDEIEKEIIRIEGISDAILIVKNEREINLFIISEKKYTESEIIACLADKIPVVCIPHHVIFLKQFPFLDNGKVDRQALQRYEVQQESVTSALELQWKGEEHIHLCQEIVTIWKEVLGRADISYTDNFFHVGGDSLMAMQIMARIKTKLNRNLSYVDFFKCLTISSLADFLLKMDCDKEKEIIVPAPQSDYYQASFSQERFWILDRLNEQKAYYNIVMAFCIEGNIDITIFKQVLLKVIFKHEILRTSLVHRDSGVKQIIHPMSDNLLEFSYYDISMSDKREKKVKKYIDDVACKQYNLSNDILWTNILIKYGCDTYVYTYSIHHSICDGWSLNILLRDIMHYYKQITQNYDSDVQEELEFQYKDYAFWQKKNLQQGGMSKSRQYWLERLSGNKEYAAIPYDYSKKKIQSVQGRSITFEFEDDIVAEIMQYCSSNHVNLYTFFVSVIYILVYKYTMINDIIIGSPVSGRNREDIENQVGPYINMMVLRNSVDDYESFTDFLKKIERTINHDLEHQDYPFEQLISDLNIKRDAGYNPLYDIDVVLQNQKSVINEIDNIKVRPIHVQSKYSKLGITFMFIQNGKNISAKFEYKSDLYKESTIWRLKNQIISIIVEGLQKPTILIKDICMLSKTEKNKIIYKFNDTNVRYSFNKTINQYIEELANNEPNRICFVEQKGEYSYRELNQYSNQFARYIQKVTGESCNRIGILLDRSFSYIIAVMAVIKLGRTFIPLDFRNSRKRNEYILVDADVKCLISESIYANELEFNELIIEVDDEKICRESSENLNIINDSYETMYILYTSGTEANPKGVMIPQVGLINYCLWAIDSYVKNTEANFAFFTSIGFDLTMTSIFVPLMSGACIYSYNEESIYTQLAQIMKNPDIYVVKLTPAHLKILKKMYDENIYGMHNLSFASKTLIVGGEKLETDVANNIYEMGVENIYNEYGPTEAVVGCMIKKFNKNIIDESVSIGAPAANTKIYIMDRYLKVVPLGVIGEIYIQREGLMSGYVNLEKESKKRLVTNPYNPSEVLYRTGDLAYMTDMYEVMYVGRCDDQIKIAGHRIELSQIEACLAEYKTIESAVLIYDEISDCINAYIVAEEINLQELYDYLDNLLPRYLIPKNFFKIPAIPMTVNGKRNYKGIIESAEPLKYDAKSHVDSYYRSVILEECKLLVGDTVKENCNFFDMGFTSLTIIRLLDNLREKYAIDIPLISIFEYPTIDEVCLMLENKDKKVEVFDGIETDGTKKIDRLKRLSQNKKRK